MLLRLPFFALAAVAFAVNATEGYYQHPTTDGEQLVFSAEGDLWISPLAGGTALRLTSHLEIETDPVFSLDAKTLAFIGSYDEGPELYVMPVSGGSPKRLTFNGAVVSIEGWTTEGQVIYVTSGIRGPTRETVIRAIDPVDSSIVEWPLSGANQASLGNEGRLYFTRLGLHRTGDHAKHYRGGAMAQLWSFDAGEKEATRLLTDFDANAKRPMWANSRLYFLADRKGTYNIWSIDEAGGDLRQHSHHDGWDVRNPELRGKVIVYQLGADLYQLDLTNDASTGIAITLRSDLDPRRERWLANPLDYISSMELARKGDQLAVTARARIALIGLPGDRRVVIPVAAEHRARGAVMGAEGRWVYAIVAVDNYDEIFRFAADGSGDTEQLTEDGHSRRWRLNLSPDGRYLAHSDNRGGLWVLDLDNKKNLRIDRFSHGDDNYADLAWSADGQLLAYARPADVTRVNQIALYDTENKRLERLTTDRFPSHSPAFSTDRSWLYFVSDRHYQATPGAPWGDRNMGPMFDRRGKVYALALDAEARFPFLPKALGNISGEPKEEDKGDKKDGDEPEPATPVAWKGLAERLYEAPIPAGNYARLEATEKHLYLIDAPLHGDPNLISFEISEKAKTETFAAKVSDFDLSADGKKLFYRVENAAFIVDTAAKAPTELADHTVNFQDWKLAINPDREWQQMFDDAWRMHRDFSFDRKLRGMDWQAVREKYQPLVQRVTHRAELDDLLGEMISELGILHSQVGRAELVADPEQPVSAVLGAEYEAGPDGLRITHILAGDPDLPEERSPLARPEADVRVGDTIVSVNFQPIRSEAELAWSLGNQVGQPVVLEISRPGEEKRQTSVMPIAANELLRRRYRDWEQANRSKTEAAGDGQIGYLHLYAMGGSDVADFAREFYPLLRRDGLIIDVRRNRGGNVDSWIINALMRKVWGFWQTPDAPETSFENMQQAYRGHVAVLIDQYTYSDGETFAAGIKALDVAPLIGKRTAGAGIWLTGRNPLVDNGVARIAEFAQYGMDGRWLIEGYGVSPDIEVDNLPHATHGGFDAQLERAIAYLQQKIEQEPIPTLKGKKIPAVGTPAQDVD